MYIFFCNSFLGLKILSGSKKINWNRVKDIGLVRFQVHGKLPIGYVFGHAISVWVWILPENSSGTQSMRNILFRFCIFGYFGYVAGVTDILLTFKFGFSVIVLDKFSKFKIYFRYLENFLVHQIWFQVKLVFWIFLGICLDFWVFVLVWMFSAFGYFRFFQTDPDPIDTWKL